MSIRGANKPCCGHPMVGGAYITNGDLFNLYCTEIGKPHELICFYQRSLLVDVEVLQWVRDINGVELPGFLDTIESN